MKSRDNVSTAIIELYVSAEIKKSYKKNEVLFKVLFTE